jgi:hypothetical protein
MLYKNKLRTYYYFSNIINPILYYKDLKLESKNLKLKKLILNFKIIKEKNIKFFYNLIDIFYFFKLFSNKFSIKNLIIGDFKNFLKNIENTNIFCIVQIILKNKYLFLFFNFIYIFFKYNLRKKNFFKNGKFVINFLKKFNKLFFDLNGLLEISIESKKNKSINNKLYFLINFLYLLNDK